MPDRIGSIVIGLGGTGTETLVDVKSKRFSRLFYNDDDSMNIKYLSICDKQSDVPNNNDFWDLTDSEIYDLNVAANASRTNGRGRLKQKINGITHLNSIKNRLNNLIIEISQIQQQGGIFRTVLNNAGGVVNRDIQKVPAGGNFHKQREINIFIIAGSGGGTGSGTFIDIGYLLKELRNEHRSQNIFIKTVGILIMPNPNDDNTYAGREARLSNSVQLLRDLNVVQDERNAFRRVNGTMGFGKPFDVVLAVDGTTNSPNIPNGVLSLPAIRDMVAEFIHLSTTSILYAKASIPWDNLFGGLMQERAGGQIPFICSFNISKQKFDKAKLLALKKRKAKASLYHSLVNNSNLQIFGIIKSFTKKSTFRANFHKFLIDFNHGSIDLSPDLKREICLEYSNIIFKYGIDAGHSFLINLNRFKSIFPFWRWLIGHLWLLSRVKRDGVRNEINNFCQILVNEINITQNDIVNSESIVVNEIKSIQNLILNSINYPIQETCYPDDIQPFNSEDTNLVNELDNVSEEFGKYLFNIFNNINAVQFININNLSTILNDWIQENITYDNNRSIYNLFPNQGMLQPIHQIVNKIHEFYSPISLSIENNQPNLNFNIVIRNEKNPDFHYINFIDPFLNGGIPDLGQGQVQYAYKGISHVLHNNILPGHLTNDTLHFVFENLINNAFKLETNYYYPANGNAPFNDNIQELGYCRFYFGLPLSSLQIVNQVGINKKMEFGNYLINLSEKIYPNANNPNIDELLNEAQNAAFDENRRTNAANTIRNSIVCGADIPVIFDVDKIENIHFNQNLFEYLNIHYRKSFPNNILGINSDQLFIELCYYFNRYAEFPQWDETIGNMSVFAGVNISNQFQIIKEFVRIDPLNYIWYLNLHFFEKQKSALNVFINDICAHCIHQKNPGELAKNSRCDTDVSIFDILHTAPQDCRFR
ncbi:hypothetical protein D9V86_11265 [Bacteroidetes/Chlorobi group bacterium ChocPot_Mid]|nr:MAG: hypothetical protein D9V86_11265 [Bacteroidetes/Chlorobi group bacterium ChocPot_Mid]